MIQNHKINPKPEFRIFFRIFVIALVVILILPVSALSGDKKTKILTKLPQFDIPQPQFFCGYCHILTYPSVVQKGYELWKKDSQEVEQEALAALAKAKLPEPKLAEARKMLNQGRENLNIVKFGNGVHNKKYSIMLIDAAITHFEDMIDFLEEGE